jgi:hypothetical protein
MMKKNSRLVTLVYGVLLLGGLNFCQPPDGSSPQDPELAELEAYLRSAAILYVEEGADLGTTDPWRVRLDDGESQKMAMFKHAPRCRPDSPNFMVDCYKYELAAYELSKLLGIPIVPPTVERTVNDTPGALQIYLEECTALNQLESVPDTEAFHRNMLTILVFDNLTYWQTGMDDVNEDIFYHDSDGRLCRVDFSKAFDTKQELLPADREVRQCSMNIYLALERLDAAAARERLASYLSGEEITALLVRRDLLLAQLTPIE